MVPDGIKRTLKNQHLLPRRKVLRKMTWMRKMNPNKNRRRGMKMQKMLGMNGPRAATLPPTIMEVDKMGKKKDEFPLD